MKSKTETESAGGYMRTIRLAGIGVRIIGWGIIALFVTSILLVSIRLGIKDVLMPLAVLIGIGALGFWAMPKCYFVGQVTMTDQEITLQKLNQTRTVHFDDINGFEFRQKTAPLYPEKVMALGVDGEEPLVFGATPLQARKIARRLGPVLNRLEITGMDRENLLAWQAITPRAGESLPGHGYRIKSGIDDVRKNLRQ